ncbi:hypothetical protein [Natronomonas sp. EA1]|uniref:hypothetical protein n=1 Tax=Natronomonas sp. EA1 TaxID=3421655 RepID=UPI003EB94A55
MVSRTVVAVVGIVASLAVSVAIYLATGQLFAFLVVPFVPLLLSRGRERETRVCPTCGFETAKGYDYCPRDGTELNPSSRESSRPDGPAR